MAMTAQEVSEAAKASSQNNNISTLTTSSRVVTAGSTEPRSSIQDNSVPNTTKTTGSFLDSHELAQFRNSALFAARACQADMKKRKELSEGLLAPVFNADPSRVDAFFKQPHAKKEMVLAKSAYREGYHSKKLNQFVCFRNWKSVSSLQAAALCLDKFLLMKLLAPIVADDTLRLRAKKQLEEIRNRIAKEKKESQDNILTSANTSSASAPTGKEADAPRVERKETAEKTQISADSSEYAAPIKALLKAYLDYITLYRSVSSQKKLDDLDNLWDIVGSCHKRLPRYLLQEIFKAISWSEDPEFTLEPPRGELRYYNNDLLDLDGLGDGTLAGLYKAGDQECCVTDVRDGSVGLLTQVDLKALRHLYELRLAELGNIIECLKTRETALALIHEDKSANLTSKP